MDLRPCPNCDDDDIRIEPEYVGYTVYCANCLDVDWKGEERGYVSSEYVAWGQRLEEAIANWNEYALSEQDDEPERDPLNMTRSERWAEDGYPGAEEEEDHET